MERCRYGRHTEDIPSSYYGNLPMHLRQYLQALKGSFKQRIGNMDEKAVLERLITNFYHQSLMTITPVQQQQTQFSFSSSSSTPSTPRSTHSNSSSPVSSSNSYSLSSSSSSNESISPSTSSGLSMNPTSSLVYTSVVLSHDDKSKFCYFFFVTNRIMKFLYIFFFT